MAFFSLEDVQVQRRPVYLVLVIVPDTQAEEYCDALAQRAEPWL